MITILEFIVISAAFILGYAFIKTSIESWKSENK